MAKVRSPNYPSIPLRPALEAMRPAFKAENRYKMSRSVLAKHLGYTSLNGRALGKIGAVRAYGLIEGSGDELRISEDAVTALMAPEGSPERVLALGRLALRPTLFQELRKDSPDGSHPSVDNLIFMLVKRGFTSDAAEKAAKNYLSTMSLVAGVPDSYNPPDEEDGEEEVGEPASSKEQKPLPPLPPTPHLGSQKALVMAGEREITAGMLSKGASFRLIVSGAIGVKEIDMLIKKLTLDKEILADEPVEDDGEDLV